jgi:hypothetical protein
VVVRSGPAVYLEQWKLTNLIIFSLIAGINSGVRLITAVPKSPAGKVLRRELHVLARNEVVNAAAKL